MARQKPRNRSNDAYYKALISETLENLGLEIHHFRNMRKSISESQIGKDMPKDMLFLVDSIYQATLDGIFDGLVNAKDLHVENIAIDGLDKSMRVRRGFARKEDVL